MKNILKSMNKEIKLNDDELYSISQVAVFLNFTPYTVRRFVREGTIKGYKYNGYNIRIKGSDLRDYINSLEIEAKMKEPESRRELIYNTIKGSRDTLLDMNQVYKKIQDTISNIPDEKERINLYKDSKFILENSIKICDNLIDFYNLGIKEKEGTEKAVIFEGLTKSMKELRDIYNSDLKSVNGIIERLSEEQKISSTVE